MKVFVSSILVSEFARAKHQRTAACKVVSEFARASEFVSDVRICTCFRIRVRCQNLHVLQNSCPMSEFARASEFVLKNEGCVHPRYKNVKFNTSSELTTIDFNVPCSKSFIKH